MSVASFVVIIVIVAVVVTASVVVVVKALMWTGAVIDTFVEVLVIGGWADVVINVLAGMVLGVDALTNMEIIEVIAVVTAVVAALKFAMPTPFEELSC